MKKIGAKQCRSLIDNSEFPGKVSIFLDLIAS